MHILRHIVIFSILMLALAACSGDGVSTTESAAAPDMKVSAPAPAVKVAHGASDGGQIPEMDAAALEAFIKANKGTATMIMLWTTWCPSCKQQLPELEQLVKTHGDKVNVIAMSLDENKDALVSYLEKKPMSLPVVWGDQQIARDHGVEAIPTLLIFDRSGQKIFGQSGVFPASMLGAMADKLVNE